MIYAKLYVKLYATDANPSYLNWFNTQMNNGKTYHNGDVIELTPEVRHIIAQSSGRLYTKPAEIYANTPVFRYTILFYEQTDYPNSLSETLESTTEMCDDNDTLTLLQEAIDLLIVQNYDMTNIVIVSITPEN